MLGTKVLLVLEIYRTKQKGSLLYTSRHCLKSMVDWRSMFLVLDLTNPNATSIQISCADIWGTLWFILKLVPNALLRRAHGLWITAVLFWHFCQQLWCCGPFGWRVIFQDKWLHHCFVGTRRSGWGKLQLVFVFGETGSYFLASRYNVFIRVQLIFKENPLKISIVSLSLQNKIMDLIRLVQIRPFSLFTCLFV